MKPCLPTARKISRVFRYRQPLPLLSPPTFSSFPTSCARFSPLQMVFAFWALFTILIFLGYLMISRWKFPSLKRLNVRVASFQVVLLTVLTAVLFVYGFLHHFAVVFFVASWFYIGVAIIFSVARLIRGRKSNILEDFEPEPEEELED